MGKYDYARLARTAQRLIDRFGVACVIKYQTKIGNPNPSKPQTIVPVELTTVGAFLTFSTDEVANFQIPTSDVKVLIAGINITDDVKTTGYIVANGETWKIQNMWVVNPGGIKLLWKLQVRK